MNKKNNREIGGQNELIAADKLRESGYEIIEMNYRNKTGEIDIIAKDGKYLVFVEVKYRKSHISGYPEEAVDVRKQKRILKTAQYYLLEHNISYETPCRFDVIALDDEGIRIIENGFGGI